MKKFKRQLATGEAIEIEMPWLLWMATFNFKGTRLSDEDREMIIKGFGYDEVTMAALIYEFGVPKELAMQHVEELAS